MFTHRFRVRYHETDPQKFLFNSRYLEYADVAMAEYFRALGWSYPELLDEGFDPSVVSSNLDFRRPAYLDDQVDVAVKCTKVGTSSLSLRFEFTVRSVAACTVDSVYVNVDPASACSRAIPNNITHKLRADLSTPVR